MLADWLFLDLETDLEGRVHQVAAVRGEQKISLSGADCLARARSSLDEMAGVAVGVAGHNVVDHDLPILGRLVPDLKLLSLPVADTLLLSPICFAENPYHRLVKDYKLVPQSRNDPLLDAALSASLLKDEMVALSTLAQNAPDIFTVLSTLLGTCENRAVAMGWLHVSGQVATALAEDVSFPESLAGRVCTTALNNGLEPVETDEKRWALAYALSWLRVSGAHSVLPPWVRHRFPATVGHLRALRDTPCESPTCAYCRAEFEPTALLKRYFGFPDFRPEPQAADGSSLQQAVVTAGLRGESLLAIMPTGGGKSLCFQLPALARNFRRGQLTVVVSPLQALMKDQVDGLIRRTGMENAAALYGMLTMPERGQVLRRTALGDLAILYLSPEQLRNRSVRKALANREIGCWVMDEAHCLSKWGHDFRPDYLYVGRFIRQLAKEQQASLPPLACFTATAKPNVMEEIADHVQRETGTTLARYIGGVERDNLHFEVQTVGAHGRLPRIGELLRERLGSPEAPDGCAVVFRATRENSVTTANFLRGQGWGVEAFHAGLLPSEKKRIQDAFIGGGVPVICATNAFGMGIDKDNVRVVIHGDTPGSLENYLQEAGRAGRDRQAADCILLYSEEDCEQQFRLGAYSELTRKDIAELLRALRRAAGRHKTDEIVVTTGELLRDEEVTPGIDVADRMADTKVRTAIAWLERAGLIERNDNRTNVIQARPLVGSLDEAAQKMAALSLSGAETGLWTAILRELMDPERNESITVDEIALLPEFRSYATPRNDAPERMVRERASPEYVSAKVLRILDSMTKVGLLKKDTLLSAYVCCKGADHSKLRLEGVVDAEVCLIGVLRELEPDPEGWLPLDGRLLSDELVQRGVSSSTELIRKLLRSISEDGRGFAGQVGSLDVRPTARERYVVRVKRGWSQLAEVADRRRRVAQVLLDALFAKVPEDVPAQKDLLVSFSFEELREALERDPSLRVEMKDPLAALERGLMYLHEQGVIVLQQGLSVFRSAMAIKVFPEMSGQRYTKENHEALDLHYRERIFQVHVMNAYAQAALRRIDEALRLILSYFSVSKEAFIELYFHGQQKLLEHATTERSFRAIVDALGNKNQMRIVTAPARRNQLILAGPGSGKTRVIVHRVAYLLRVRRVKPSAILVCCFNHKAAIELRRRLVALVGADARGVIIQTYHGLALRLLGRSAMPGKNEAAREELPFDRMIEEATTLLKDERPLPGVEPDEVRDRLLAGFEFILVDEYQDIDAPQYELISALAGRREQDEDRKLTILAVGDDDQNVYTFRGANVEFIRRFQRDYDAESAYLVENYRSTGAIIEAANRVIARNRDRMKTEHPIRIDQARELLPLGGVFGASDAQTRGQVALLSVPDIHGQAVSVVREIRRLRELGVDVWSRMAVLARHYRDLAAIRSVAEAEGVPVAWPLERAKVPPLHRIREIRAVLDALRARHSGVITLEGARTLVPTHEGNPWVRLLGELLEGWAVESGGEAAPVSVLEDYLYEGLAQRRRDETWGEGVVLQTVHSAKGTEYAHVLLCGDWTVRPDASIEEERRLFYVGMTRARETLCVFNREDTRHAFVKDLAGFGVIQRGESQVNRGGMAMADWSILGMEDVFLDYAGRSQSDHSVHRALAALRAGDEVSLREAAAGLGIFTREGAQIGRLSERAAEAWRGRMASIRGARVLGLLVRRAEDVVEAEFRKRLVCDRWEIPWIEISHTP